MNLKALSQVADALPLTDDDMFHDGVYTLDAGTNPEEINNLLKNYNIRAEYDSPRNVWMVAAPHVRAFATILNSTQVGVGNVTDPEGKSRDIKTLIYKSTSAPQIKELRK